MLKRVVVGIIAALFAVGMLAIRFTPVFPLVVAFFAVVASFELLKVIGIKNKAIHILSLIFAGLIPLYYGFNSYLVGFGINIPVTAVLVFYILLMFILMLTDYEHTKFEDVAAVIVSTIFVPWGFSTLIMLRDIGVTFPGQFDKHYGLFFILLALFCAWLTDSFAYFAGRFFGKHKMAPNISPKKTIEGAVGGALGGVISSVILFAVFDNCYFTVHVLKYWQIILVALVLCVVGMCGDLTASVVKRNFGVKDYGNFFPGHGGVMDRFDSALFVLCALYGIIVFSRTVFIC